MTDFKRVALCSGLLAALVMSPLHARADPPSPPPVTTVESASRAEHLKAAAIYGVTAGGLLAGGVALWAVGAVAFPVAWLLMRPFPPTVTLGEPWEHALAFAALPWLAMGGALCVAAGGFAVMALTQAALLR